MMHRREFITILGATAVVPPMAGRAQQPMPSVIGYLSLRSPDEAEQAMAAFRQGLQEHGYTEPQNVTIEQRWAEGQYDRLSALASDLVARNVNVLVATGGTGSAIAAQAATATIPIVFAMGGDPVKLGVVSSLARPGGNITGVSFLVNGLATKEVELLHELVPTSTSIAFLVNPDDPNTVRDSQEAQAAADAFGLKLIVLNAPTAADIENAFMSIVNQRAGALFVNVDPFLSLQRPKILALAAQQRVPTVPSVEGFAADGGLISYGTSINEANRQLGVYTGLVLKGTKPADLPVVQPTKFQLVINLNTAKMLGLKVPDKLLALADDVIE